MEFRFGRRGPQTNVYLVQKARRNGKVVNAAEMYLGTTAAFLAADEELGFCPVVEELTGSRATALSPLAFIAGRAHEPVSKNGMTHWANCSLLRSSRVCPISPVAPTSNTWIG